MDTPPRAPPTGRKLIDAYGDGGFRVSGERFDGSILIVGDRVLAAAISDIAALKTEDFAAVIEEPVRPEILLIGCGRRAAFIRPEFRQALRAHGIVVDAMDTGAACRTYNVVLAEDRRVSALLIAVA